VGAQPPLALTACAAIASAGVSLAPHGQLAELRQVNERFATEGPALAFEPVPYGSHYFLRDLPPDDPAQPAVSDLTPQATSVAAAGTGSRRSPRRGEFPHQTSKCVRAHETCLR
jgi:hypothetical protein